VFETSDVCFVSMWLTAGKIMAVKTPAFTIDE
jgi:hypothetical protein